MDRRTFLRMASGTPLALHQLAAQHKGKVKITDVKCMIVRGTWDWNLVRVDTDAGVSGIGEAYWGYGVKDLIVNQLKPQIIGEDPFNVDKLYTKMLMRSAGQGALAGVTVTAASGVEIALLGPRRALAANACLQSAGRPIPRQSSLLPYDAGGAAIPRICSSGRIRSGRQNRKRQAGPLSSSRETASLPQPIRSTKNPAMTFTPAV